jgi:hypothetical protein
MSIPGESILLLSFLPMFHTEASAWQGWKYLHTLLAFSLLMFGSLAYVMTMLLSLVCHGHPVKIKKSIRFFPKLLP